MEDVVPTVVSTNLNAVCQLSEEELMGHEKIDSEYDQEDVWEMEKQDESRGAFDIFSEFDDEENL